MHSQTIKSESPKENQKENRSTSPSSLSENTASTRAVDDTSEKKRKIDHSQDFSTSNMAPRKKTLKTLKQQRKQLPKKEEKINSLDSLLTILRKKNLLESDACFIIEFEFAGYLNELFQDEWHNENRNDEDREYSDIVIQFALTLLFYSPKAYDYCRPILHLPPENSIRPKILSTNAKPGLMSDVFKRISKFPENSRHCNLIFEFIIIQTDMLWDDVSKNLVGNCDYGNGLGIGGSETEANRVLVFMLVSLTGTWKWPVGYFLTRYITDSIQAELVKAALILAQEFGIKVWSVTCDETFGNYSTMTLLGCDLYASKYSDLKTTFKHPSADYDVYFVPDSWNSMKTARFGLATCKTLKSPTARIKWSHITNLHNFEVEFNSKFTNKPTSAFMNFKADTTKIKSTAHVLNSSTVSALEFLKSSEIKKFKDCDGTIEFIKAIDEIFDFLNCRNPFGKGFKEPICYDNITSLQNRIEEKVKYLYTLKKSDNSMLDGNAKNMIIVGFAAAVKSIFGIARNILLEPSFKYLLTYRFSQDHLQLFFAQVRQKHKWNCIYAVHFMSALRSLLAKNSEPVKAARASFDIDKDVGFKLSWAKNKNLRNWHEGFIDGYETAFNKNLFRDTASPEKNYIHSYIEEIVPTNDTILNVDILYYMTSFIIKRIMQRLTCKGCIGNIVKKIGDKAHNLSAYDILDLGKNGGLVCVSRDVYKIARATEIEFLVSTDERDDEKLGKRALKKIMYRVTRRYALETNVFCNCNECFEDSEMGIEIPHRLQLINIICKKYLTLRTYSCIDSLKDICNLV